MSIYSRNIKEKDIYLAEDKMSLNNFLKNLRQEDLNNKFNMQQNDDTFSGYIKKINKYFDEHENEYIKEIVKEGAVSSAFNIIKKSQLSDTKKSNLIKEMYSNIEPELIRRIIDIKELETLSTDKNQRFIVKDFLKEGYSLNGNSQILISAIHSGDKEFFDLAIKNNANVNGPEKANKNRNTPLGWKPSPLIKDRDIIHEYMIDVLIKKGANINRFEGTPSHYLMSAITSHDKHLVETLIKKGIKIETEWNNIKMKDYIKKNQPEFYNMIYKNKNKQLAFKY